MVNQTARELKNFDSRRERAIQRDITVFKEILKDPLQKNTEIAEKIGVSRMNITDRLKKFRRMGYKSPSIEAICSRDIKNVELGQKILTKRLENNPDELSVNEIVTIIAEGTKRYSLFKGKMTDKNGGLKNVLELPMEQLRERLQELRDKEQSILEHNGRENVIDMIEGAGDSGEGADQEAISGDELEG